jgi:ABC-type dipeptide/oligopeptide/nickel transport system permease subunit
MRVGRRRVAAAVVMSFVAVLFILGFALDRFDAESIDRNWTGEPLPPCFVNAAQCYGHLLGTDNLGRDVLARLLYGSINSLEFALIALGFAVIVGLVVALISRVAGPAGRFFVERFTAAIECFPPLAFIFIMIIVGTPDRYFTLPGIAIAALVGLLFCPRISRAVMTAPRARAALTAVSDRAAQALTGIIALLATVDFLGAGVRPPYPSWGNMLIDAQENISIAWWAMVFPAICLSGALLVIEVERRLLAGVSRTTDDHLSLI